MQDKQETEVKNGQKLAGRFMDLAVAGLGLAVFVAMMFVLESILFPVGLSLKDDGKKESQLAQRSQSGQAVSYAGQQGHDDSVVAQLVSVRRNVQVKANDSLAWSSAQKGAGLFNHDSLQTLSNSGATAMLSDNSLIRVGPNSLIVFQAGSSDPFTPRRTNSLVMMEGTLGGYFSSDGSSPLHLEVALPNGVARFVPGDNATAVEFNINVNPDLSSSVSVHSGKGVITVGGQTLSIEEQHGLTISINGDVLEQGRLPPLPMAMKPRNRTAYQYRDIPPPMKFSWSVAEDATADSYRFRLARDTDMNEIVIDERLTTAQFLYEGLQDGTYYWQVSALNGFIEGPAAEPQQISLVRDEQPPSLVVSDTEYRDGKAIVRGRTDPGARVYVQGAATTTVTGSFEKSIELQPGASLIVIEAVDKAGNVAYVSQLINSKSMLNGGDR